MKDKLTTRQAAEMLGVNDSRIRQLIEAGELEASKFAHMWQVERESVERLIAWRQKTRKPRR
jgi:excisionase family DNA binding protein